MLVSHDLAIESATQATSTLHNYLILIFVFVPRNAFTKCWTWRYTIWVTMTTIKQLAEHFITTNVPHGCVVLIDTIFLDLCSSQSVADHENTRHQNTLFGSPWQQSNMEDYLLFVTISMQVYVRSPEWLHNTLNQFHKANNLLTVIHFLCYWGTTAFKHSYQLYDLYYELSERLSSLGLITSVVPFATQSRSSANIFHSTRKRKWLRLCFWYPFKGESASV